jgi:hypothetical protein
MDIFLNINTFILTKICIYAIFGRQKEPLYVDFMSQSILDQVLSSKKMSAISNFEPEAEARKLFNILNDRERDIIIKRHGLDGEKKVTLEEIGNSYSVTRERVRQVENASVKRIRDTYREDVLKNLENLLQTILEDHGSIMSEDRLIEMLLTSDKTSDKTAALVRFLLNHLINDRFKLNRESKDLYKSWSLPGTTWKEYNEAINNLITIIKQNGEPIQLEDLIGEYGKNNYTDSAQNKNFEIILLNFLDITKKIEENKFNEWGLSHWNSIRPRRMNDKIHLVMKKHNQPLHFTEIAKKINDANFDKKTAYPATIHNELILDDKYVLVGRGIYALKQWGYKPGIVLDVIKDIVRQNSNAMTREDIISEVLKNRMVKRSTVILALMNKKHFQKNADGCYLLVTE